MVSVVDLEKCDGCLDKREKGTSACVEECPVECISLVDDDPSTAPFGREQYPVIETDECTDCELCVDACEKGAISIVEED